MQRLCLDCPATFPAVKGRSRCPECQATKEQARDQRRGSLIARGYGAEYSRIAGKVRTYAKAHGSWCELCGEPFDADETIGVDHIVPVSLGGGHETWNLRPVHQRCNSSRGNQSTRTSHAASTTRTSDQPDARYPRGSGASSVQLSATRGVGVRPTRAAP
jgi:5-methylcytosine-specific restriction endonuclease McrA